MKPTDENMMEILKQPCRVVNIRAWVIKSTTTLSVSSSGIVDATITSSLSEDGTGKFGGTTSKELKITFVNSDNLPSSWNGWKIKLEIGVCSDAGVTVPEEVENQYWYNMGVYYCGNDAAEIGDNRTTVTCYDAMEQLEYINYKSNLTYPTSWLMLANELVNKKGYGLIMGGGLPNVQIKNKPVGTMRDVVKKLALYSGTNATIRERDGSIDLAFIPVQNVEPCFSIDSSNYEKLTFYSKTMADLAGIEYHTPEDEVIYSGPVNETFIIYGDENLTDDEVYNISQNANMPISWFPYELTCQGYPQIDTGDVLLVTDKNGMMQNLSVFESVLTFKGGMKSTFKANILEETRTNISSSGVSGISDSLRSNMVEINQIKKDLTNLDGANLKDNSVPIAKLNVASKDNLLMNTLSPVYSPANKRIMIKGQTHNSQISGNTYASTIGVRGGYNISMTNTSNYPYLNIGSANTTDNTGCDLIGGMTYTLSFDADYKLMSGISYGSLFGVVAYTATSTGDFVKLGENRLECKSGQSYYNQHFKYTFTLPIDYEKIYFGIRPNQTGSGANIIGDYFEVRNLMLVEGEDEYPYSPNPEDISKYVSPIEGVNGVCIHDEGNTSTYINITSTGIKIYVNGVLKQSY